MVFLWFPYAFPMALYGTPFAAGPPWRRGVRQLRARAALEDEPRGPVSDVASAGPVGDSAIPIDAIPKISTK